MEEPKITLKSEKELKIYMDPLRQRLLQTLAEIGEPVTSKKLADTMKITPSSAKYHLTKLAGIGLVEVDHTELIHGIKAVFYRMTNRTVSLETDHHDFDTDKKIICDNLVNSIYSGFCEKAFRVDDKKKFEITDGILFHGVAHLTQDDALELNKKIIEFLKAHQKKGENTVPFDYLLLAYNADKKGDGDE